MGLSAEGLSVALGGRAVLEDVTFAPVAGRVTVLLGANGAGKSTLLRALAGLVPASAGKVLLDGRDIATLPPRERACAIGYLPQDAVVHWNMRARDLVTLGRLPQRTALSDDEAAVDRAFAQTDALHLADRPVRELSGGERARVLLARVLAGEPQWLLADEPLASLDPLHQLETLDLLRATAARGVGVVVVLHDLTQAARVADDVILLSGGRLLAAGPVRNILNPDNLARAYGIRATMLHDEAGFPVIATMGRAT